MRLLLALLCPLAVTFAALADDDDVGTAKITRSALISAAKDMKAGDRVIAEVARGSIELVVDEGRDTPQVEAEFTVDGSDEKDVKRRSELVRLFAERAADQTVVVQPIFPGKAMKRDSVKLRIVVPKCGEASMKIANGALTTAGTAGKLKLVAKNGAIKISKHAGSIDANTTNGAIDIDGAGAEVRASATNGAVSVSLTDDNDLPFDVESSNGTVRVEVGAGFDGIVKMHTTTGSLDVSDSARRARTTQSTEHSKTVEIGAAGGQSDIRTTTGSIRLTVRGK
jgi:hypothetical protein